MGIEVVSGVPTESVHAQRRDEGQRRCIRVLLVEDDPEDCRFVEEMLLEHERAQIAGPTFTVVRAETLSLGIAALNSEALDVILLDLGLPDGDGFDLLSANAAMPRRLPVVILTSRQDQALAEHALSAGAQDYLLKGRVDSNALARVIKYALERQRLVQELEASVCQLTASEARFRGMVECSADAILVLDEQGAVQFASAAAEPLFGKQRSELLGVVFGLPQTETGTTEIQIVRQDSNRIVEMHATTIPWEGRTSYLASLRDITARVHALEALKRSEALLDRAQAIAHLGCWEWNVKTGRIHWSDEVYRILGLEPTICPPTYEQFLGCLHPDERGEVQRALEDALAGRRPLRLDHRIVRPDGCERIVHDEGEILYEHDSPVGLIGVVHDVTEQKLAERAVKELNAALEKRVEQRTAELTVANREMESFIYSVSHDLRAPLRQIGGFARLLVEQAGARLDAAGHHHADRIREGVKQMGLLVDGLLNLSRIGRQPLAVRATALRPVVMEVISALEVDTTGRTVEWRVGELPDVTCDPILIRQVFFNLLSNAVKFTRPRNPAIIEAGAANTSRGCALFVRDNGVGFDTKYADKLFGLFQRLHQQEDFEGTGVGLSIVQRIVQKHGGRVWAEAEPDRGCAVFFTIGASAGEGTREALDANGMH